jgi:hypothetical protein
MTVAYDMVGVPARRGGVLTDLGLAGSLPFLLSLGRGKVNERHLTAVIRARRVPRSAADVLDGHDARESEPEIK